MSDLKRFQNDHGEEWNAIIQTPAFSAAMSFLNLQKIATIANLTDEEIAANSNSILADLRGHLKHENDLFTIGTKPVLEFGGIGPETYPDPLEDIEPKPGDNSTAEEQPQPDKPPRKPRNPRKK